jgi:hypothetical protein
MKRFFLKPEKMIEEANMSLSLPLKYLPFRLGEREQNMATFGNNRLTTYKYTVLTFLPKVLFEQFHKVRILFESEDFFCSQFFFFFFFFFSPSQKIGHEHLLFGSHDLDIHYCYFSSAWLDGCFAFCFGVVGGNDQGGHRRLQASCC